MLDLKLVVKRPILFYLSVIVPADTEILQVFRFLRVRSLAAVHANVGELLRRGGNRRTGLVESFVHGYNGALLNASGCQRNGSGWDFMT